MGIGKIALASLLAESGMANEVAQADNASPFAPKSTHFPGKAKRVIYLFMAGAPSQLELFDYKPKLAEMEGKPIPPSVIAGQRYAFIQPDAAVLGPRFKFAKHGQCGAEISEMLPGLSKVVDDITILRSVHTDHFNHSPAQLFCNTGNGVPGRPSMGSWLSYGLGSEAHDLPSFVVLKSGGSLSGGAAMWNAGFLPSVHQGVPFRGQGDPILHVSNPPGFDTKAQRESLDLIRQLNQQRFDALGDPEIRTRMEAYEMAFRMQSRAPELMEFSQETQETMDLYGANPSDPKQAFANNCLLARRLAERGVRFVQVYHAGWDHHSNVEGGIRAQAKETDQACAALVEDLRRRGMLDDTLIVWGGEFGRTPMVESSAALGRSQGRDHHPQAFTMWFAGGGMKPGLTYGKTDELGFNVVENKAHVHDVQATILHALGIDHTKLIFRHRGLNFKLTGVEEHHPILDLLS
ncbi:DUF1501 domain-containing protein [Bremerella cremea]